MKRHIVFAVLTMTLAQQTASAQVQEQHAIADPEMRACWVSRFNWTREGTEQTQERIRDIMRTLKESNFNAVLFQVRGEANTLYPSPYEPWGPQFNWTDPGWDPLQFALEEARANDLEFHAYFNTHTLTSAIPPEETTPQHPYNLHGPEAEDSWVIHDKDGNPVSKTDSYTWISPGHPDASAWTRKVLMHLVEKYDVDGVHFDRIRTPGPDFSFDPKSVARFNGDGNPDGGEWGDFMRDCITQDLRRIYGAIALRKPHIKVTATPFGISRKIPGGYQGTGTESHFEWHQDSFGWMEKGVLDAIFPMIYWRIDSPHPFDVLLADFLEHTGGRHIYAGIHAGRDPIAQIYETRRQCSPGSTIWSYGSGEFGAFVAAPYNEPAPIPAMPWKEEPTTGIVAGTITDESGLPLLDAWVWVRGGAETSLSGGDGFYSVLNLEPGTHTITVRKNGVGEIARTVTVDAGEARELNIVIPQTDDATDQRSSTARRLIREVVALAHTDATRLRPEYVRAALESPDEEMKSLLQKTAARGGDEDKLALIRNIELKFIHDPETSALDLLEPEERDRFLNFEWEFGDYPGGPEGSNEEFAREMAAALSEVRPERRANSGHDPVIVRDEATEEVWEYMESEWVPVPGQEDYMLNRHAAASFVKMREQAAKEGVDLRILSAHRSRAKAEANAARANNPTAVASFSTHSLGLAVDFQMSHGDLEFSEITTRPMSEVVRMRESPVHKWIVLRADEFGWFPYQHEPWHWEYNPQGFRATYWENFPGGAPAREE